MPEIYHWDFCVGADCLLSAAYNWQTLIGAVAAIGAAWHAGRIVREQINAAQNQENIRYLRRLNAARAVLPLTLSGIAKYASEVAAYLIRSKQEMLAQTDQNEKSLNLPPEVPGDLINHIAAVIEATDDNNVIVMLQKIVEQIQILNSRIHDIKFNQQFYCPNLSFISTLEVYLLQCCIIYARSSEMFSFARFETDTVPNKLPWKAVYSAFSLLKIDQFDYPQLFSCCARAEKEGRDPP